MPKTEITNTNETAKAALALPEINPTDVKLSHEGFQWREVLVRVPHGLTADDLRSPKIWRRVQGNPQVALQRLDHLLILASDESWMVRAIVTLATNEEAHLMIEKVSSFREIGNGSLYSDGTYRVAFTGGSFFIERVADGVRVDNAGYGTEQAAIAAIRHQYPRKAG